MRYFTREQHDRANSSDLQEAAASLEAFKRCCELYRRQLDRLKPRLADAWSFFDTVSLHDGTLLALRIGDDIDKNFPAYGSGLVNRRTLSVELEALHHTETQLYTLRYERLHRVLFDFPSPQPWHMRFSDRASNPIDDWMADEITAVDDQILRHEVLFSSGATLLIEFEQVTIRNQIIEGREGLPYVEPSA
jgi:hypothetical protein